MDKNAILFSTKPAIEHKRRTTLVPWSVQKILELGPWNSRVGPGVSKIEAGRQYKITMFFTTFIIYLLLYWCYKNQPQNFFGEKKVYLLWETKLFLMGNQKWQNKFEFEKLKISNPNIWPFWEIFNFSNSIFFCHFWFPIKKIFFSQSKHTFVLGNIS